MRHSDIANGLLARARKFGHDEAWLRQKYSEIMCSRVLGREFGESCEAFVARNPELAAFDGRGAKRDLGCKEAITWHSTPG